MITDFFIILIAVNEDGFGPSSMAYHLVHALLESCKNCAIILRTGTKDDFNRRLYADVLSQEPAPGHVCIDAFHNLIQLVNRGDGRIDAESSLIRTCVNILPAAKST